MDSPSPDQVELESARRRRSARIAFLLTFSTMLGLVFAWAQPEDTVAHFWWVTQCLPLFYLILAVWAAWPLPGEAEE